MFLTWIFRALFVPLLILAIITSNCSAADTGSAVGTELALVASIALGDPVMFAARLGHLWWDASTSWTSTRAYKGCELLLECL